VNGPAALPEKASDARSQTGVAALIADVWNNTRAESLTLLMLLAAFCLCLVFSGWNYQSPGPIPVPLLLVLAIVDLVAIVGVLASAIARVRLIAAAAVTPPRRFWAQALLVILFVVGLASAAAAYVTRGGVRVGCEPCLPGPAPAAVPPTPPTASCDALAITAVNDVSVSAHAARSDVAAELVDVTTDVTATGYLTSHKPRLLLRYRPARDAAGITTVASSQQAGRWLARVTLTAMPDPESSRAELAAFACDHGAEPKQEDGRIVTVRVHAGQVQIRRFSPHGPEADIDGQVENAPVGARICLYGGGGDGPRWRYLGDAKPEAGGIWSSRVKLRAPYSTPGTFVGLALLSQRACQTGALHESDLAAPAGATASRTASVPEPTVKIVAARRGQRAGDLWRYEVEGRCRDTLREENIWVYEVRPGDRPSLPKQASACTGGRWAATLDLAAGVTFLRAAISLSEPAVEPGQPAGYRVAVR
jgi:hypothetical protein